MTEGSIKSIEYSGPCTHPAVEFRDGRPYCTECGQLRG